MDEEDVEVQEGATRLIVPRPPSDRGPGMNNMPVFYNPVMKVNRDMSVCLFRALERRSIRSIDLLAATGAAGVRLLTEVDGDWDMVINDVNPISSEYIKRNLRLNRRKANVTTDQAPSALAVERFDHIDIDPFGTPVPFVPHAVGALRNKGILSVTATDTAVLCGTYPKASWRRYGVRTGRTPFKHELGVRALISYVVRRFAERDRSAVPLMSYADEHFYRAFFIVGTGSRRTDDVLDGMGFINYVQETGERSVVHEPGPGLIGPIWVGDLGRQRTIRSMMPVSKRTERLLYLLSDEAEAPPLHYNTEEFGRFLKGRVLRTVEMLRVLRLGGWEAVPTHFSPTGFRTDATVMDIKEAVSKRKGL